MMSGCGILTNGKGTRREYGQFNLDELTVGLGQMASYKRMQCDVGVQYNCLVSVWRMSLLVC